jgi:uncharacterized protein YlxP (DUF503 family)
MGAVVGCLYLDLFISEPQSLKDKRRVLRRIRDRARQKFQIALAEIDGQDLWQSCRLAVVAVSNERQQVDRMLGAVANWVEHEPGCVVSGRRLEWR